MPEQTLQERYADKIAKILAKAERTDNADEAQIFFAAAQRLMSQYSIEQVMVDVARGIDDEEIVERMITYRGIYHAARYSVGRVVGDAQDVMTLIGKGRKDTTLHLVGFESDVERAIYLDSKVQIQALSAQSRWTAEHANALAALKPMGKFKEKREFLFGYAVGLDEKLERAKTAGREDAVAAGLERGSMELTVRNRLSKIESWYQDKYGEIKTISRSFSRGSRDANESGQLAGLNADVGSAGRLKQRQSLPEGSA